jgi:SAM-dependent methyltransferase
MEIVFCDPVNKEGLILSPEGMKNAKDIVVYPLKAGAYRVVEDNNYTENFGKQWNLFQKTQIDEHSSSNQSKERFFVVTNWDKIDLTNQNILEVGSGAGRFTEIVLNYTKANLYSVDYSNAVEANFRNNGHHSKLSLFQASIYELPFLPGQFDKVFCFGVLQHTPDFEKSIKSLAEMVKPGGEFIVDFYPVKGWWTKIHAKYLIRPFTKKMNHEKLLKTIARNADWMINLSTFFNKIGLGRITNRFIPICDIKNTLPQNLNKKELREWVILDTFDMLSPQYDHPQKVETVKKWAEKYNIQITFSGHILYGNNSVAVVKGIKK